MESGSNTTENNEKETKRKDTSRDDNFSPRRTAGSARGWRRFENLLLLLGRESGIEGETFDLCGIGSEILCFFHDLSARIFDFLYYRSALMCEVKWESERVGY